MARTGRIIGQAMAGLAGLEIMPLCVGFKYIPSGTQPIILYMCRAQPIILCMCRAQVQIASGTQPVQVHTQWCQANYTIYV